VLRDEIELAEGFDDELPAELAEHFR